MYDSKSTSDILLEEKIAQIDDINFDKIYDVDEFGSKQLETFASNDNNSIDDLKFENQDNEIMLDSSSQDVAFELELQPNEFLDSLDWSSDVEAENIGREQKFNISNKPLFYTFTSIAVLLCILFIYNVFVINNLSHAAKATGSLNTAAVTTYVVSEEENDYITFDNESKMKIRDFSTSAQDKNMQNSNWFDAVCNYVSKVFGGSY